MPELLAHESYPVSWLQHAAKWEEPPGEEGPAPGVPVPVLSRVRRRRTGTPRPANRFRQSDSMQPWPSRAIWASPMPPTPIRESGPEGDPSTRAIHIRLAQVEWLLRSYSFDRRSAPSPPIRSIRLKTGRLSGPFQFARRASTGVALGLGAWAGSRWVATAGATRVVARASVFDARGCRCGSMGPRKVPERITGTS